MVRSSLCQRSGRDSLRAFRILRSGFAGAVQRTCFPPQGVCKSARPCRRSLPADGAAAGRICLDLRRQQASHIAVNNRPPKRPPAPSEAAAALGTAFRLAPGGYVEAAINLRRLATADPGGHDQERQHQPGAAQASYRLPSIHGVRVTAPTPFDQPHACPNTAVHDEVNRMAAAAGGLSAGSTDKSTRPARGNRDRAWRGSDSRSASC